MGLGRNDVLPLIRQYIPSPSAAQARARAADMRHNAQILTDPTPHPSRLPKDTEALAAATTNPSPTSPAPAGSYPSDLEDTDDLATQIQSLI